MAQDNAESMKAYSEQQPTNTTTPKLTDFSLSAILAAQDLQPLAQTGPPSEAKDLNLSVLNPS